MSTASATQAMTTEEMLALPDNDVVHRELILGELRERPVTVRNKEHSRILINIGFLLKDWQRRCHDEQGIVCGGEVGCILRRNPDTTVGVDVAYVSKEVASRDAGDTTLIDGAPILAIEILSPSDTVAEIQEKVEQYLDCGVRHVWTIHPGFHTVTVHRSDAEPALFTVHQQLSAEPDMPGLSIPVSAMFE